MPPSAVWEEQEHGEPYALVLNQSSVCVASAYGREN